MSGETETLSTTLPDDVEQSARSLLDHAANANCKLAVAESCTGGLLASILTDIEGKSHIFERGFIVYSNRAKCDLLGLDRKEVEDCGAVSEPVARRMAEGALARSEADIAAAITGFAGPAWEDEEEGLVYLACARRRGGTKIREEHFGACGRGAIRVAAIEVAIDMMRKALEEMDDA